MSTKDSIQTLKEHGRYSAEAVHGERELREWERTLRFDFPQSYRSTVLGGSYDLANFYFRDPFIPDHFPGFVAFAEWNDDLFAFSAGDSGAEGPVYVLLEGSQPLKKYADFGAWFASAVEMAERPINPE